MQVAYEISRLFSDKGALREKLKDFTSTVPCPQVEEEKDAEFPTIYREYKNIAGWDM